MSFFSIDLDKQDFLLALTAVNSAMREAQDMDACLREVNFMCYELDTLCSEMNEPDRLMTLNHFLFVNKNFKTASRPVLLDAILANRSGCISALALLYIHLANRIGLKLQLVHWPLHAILKWVTTNGKTAYIDLDQRGKILCEEELLVVINKHKDQVQTLTFREAVVQYASTIAQTCREDCDGQNLHTMLNFILQIDPENTRYLSERALLRKQLGLYKESLADFKRYFSFNDKQYAPLDLQSAYDDVRSRCDLNLNYF